MKKLLLAFGALIGLTSYAQQTNETIDINGTTRSYIQYLPSSFNVNEGLTPMIFILHGMGGDGANMASIGTNLLADQNDYILIYPDGLNGTTEQAAWNNGTLIASNADDVSFFTQLIDKLVFEKGVDPNRVYMCGFSMGGIMSLSMACEMNDRLAAVASMSGTMSSSSMGSCNPTYKTPVLQIHGTSDATVPYDGAALPTLELVEPTLNFWKNVHGCDANVTAELIPDTANDGLTVERYVYSNCNPAGSVEHWKVIGGNHNYFYQPVNDFTEATEIIRFFGQWSHSNPTLSIENQNKIESSIAPNPAVNEVTITVSQKTSAQIIGLDGKTVLSLDLNEGDNLIQIENLNSGVYMIQFKGNTSKKLIVQ